MAIVSDVRVSHEDIPVADRRLAAAAARAAMDRDEFAEDVLPTDAKIGFFPSELEILWNKADGSERKDFRPVADFGEPVDHR